MSFTFAATDFDFETLLAFLRVAPASDTMIEFGVDSLPNHSWGESR